MLLPAITGSIASIFTIDRSAEVDTASTSVAESFEASGSGIGDDVMETVFVRVASAYPAGIAIVS